MPLTHFLLTWAEPVSGSADAETGKADSQSANADLSKNGRGAGFPFEGRG